MKKRNNRMPVKAIIYRDAKRISACILSAVFLLACCPLAYAAEEEAPPLTPEQIAQMTDAQIAAISQEQSDATLNKMSQLFLDGEKESLDKYLKSLGFSTTYNEFEKQQHTSQLELKNRFEAHSGIQPLWQSDYSGDKPEKLCHETLTAYGFLVYIGAMQELFGMSGSFGYSLSDMQILSSNAGYPDYDLEMNDHVTYVSHFYDPDTGKNIIFQSGKTAKTEAQLYYDLAASSYSKSTELSMKYLAYSLHYVQDVGVPHHAANKGAVSSLIDPYNHAGFEKLASKIIIEENFVNEIEIINERSFYDALPSQSTENFAHNIAVDSKIWLDMASDKSNETRQRLAAVATLSLTLVNTSGLLYKLAEEVGSI